MLEKVVVGRREVQQVVGDAKNFRSPARSTSAVPVAWHVAGSRRMNGPLLFTKLAKSIEASGASRFLSCT